MTSSGDGPSSAAKPGASASIPRPPSAPKSSAASPMPRATASAAAPPSTRRSPPTAATPPKQGSAGTRSSATPATATRRVAAASVASHRVAPGGTHPASTQPTASTTGSEAAPASSAPSSLPPEGRSRTALSRPSSPPSTGGGAASEGDPSTSAASKATTHQSTAPAEPVASGTPSPAPALPPLQMSRTRISRPSTPPLPGGSSSLELSPTAVAASAVTTHQAAAAPASVTSGASVSDSLADSDSSRGSIGTSTPAGESSRRPPLPPRRASPGDGPLAAQQHRRREGAEEGNQVRAKALVTLADAKAVTIAGSEAGTKADAKVGTTAAARTGANAGANERFQRSGKRHSKVGGKAVANQVENTSVKNGTNTTGETTGAVTRASAGDRVAAHVMEGGVARRVGTSTSTEPLAADTASPTPAGSRARRGRSAFGLAADALQRTTRSGKGRAAAEPAAALPAKKAGSGSANGWCRASP